MKPFDSTKNQGAARSAAAVFLALAAATGLAGPAGIPYSIGSPTAKEQLYVELINRARANPTAEGIRFAGLASTQPDIAAAYGYFSVNLATMQAEFVSGSAAGKPTLNGVPPLSINAKLTAVAREHSQDQITWDYQGHPGHDGSTLGTRITAQGYSWFTYGENVFTSSESVLYGHAGFEVDWGGSDGTGMQGPPRGHRSNIHSGAFREIGVGNLTDKETVIPTTNTISTGPEVVTQNLATASGSTPFITGVVYYDFNGNSFYDPGEGIGGVEVGATGSASKGVTAASGGYSIPVPGSGTYPLSFWFPGAASAANSTSVTVSGGLNVKADWVPAYAGPGLTGSPVPLMGTVSNYTFGTVNGAVSYDLRVARISAMPAAEGADSGAAGYTMAAGSSGYLAVEPGGAAGNCFRFGHNGLATPTLTLNRVFIPKAGATVSFQSKLGIAATTEVARLQVRPEGGAWVTLWSQAGSGGFGESAYTLKTSSLAAYAGQQLEIRFLYEFAGGSFFSTSYGEAGWFVDNIGFTATEELVAITTVNSASITLPFTPAATGAYRLWARPRLADPLYQSAPWSAPLEVTAVPGGYAGWVASLYPTVTGGAGADQDRDGIANGAEYAFGLNPTVPNSQTALPQATRGGANLEFNYTAPAGLTGVTYGAEWSADLATWTPLTDTGTSQVLNGSGSGTSHSFTVSTTGKPRLFLRHKIVIAP